MTQTSEAVLLEERRPNGVHVLTLNRPESLNSLSRELQLQLGDVMERIDEDRSIACLVLTGAGRGFCSGGDVKAMAGRRGSSDDGTDMATEFESWENEARDLRRRHERLPLRLYQLSKPSIAIINGPVAGAGLGIACACDLRIASERASFVTAFGRIGRSGDYGTSYFLRQLVGPARARELYFTSDRLDATQALAIGLINHVYPHEEFMQRGLELADRIAQGPVRAHARMKEALRAADAGDLRRVLEIEALYMSLSGRTREGEESLQRFLERGR